VSGLSKKEKLGRERTEANRFCGKNFVGGSKKVNYDREKYLKELAEISRRN